MDKKDLVWLSQGSCRAIRCEDCFARGELGYGGLVTGKRCGVNSDKLCLDIMEQARIRLREMEDKERSSSSRNWIMTYGGHFLDINTVSFVGPIYNDAGRKRLMLIVDGEAISIFRQLHEVNDLVKIRKEILDHLGLKDE